MTHASSTATRKPLRPSRAILYGTLVVGTLDIADVIIFYALRGVAPIRIFHSIAAGLLGRTAARAGGLATAVLGGFLHYFIALMVVLTYYLASKRLGVLTRHPVICGLLYGLAVYFFMNLVIVPLSAAGGSWPPAETSVLVNGILIHLLGVGLPASLFARAARPVVAM